jgi:hypothetical protein
MELRNSTTRIARRLGPGPAHQYPSLYGRLSCSYRTFRYGVYSMYGTHAGRRMYVCVLAQPPSREPHQGGETPQQQQQQPFQQGRAPSTHEAAGTGDFAGPAAFMPLHDSGNGGYVDGPAQQRAHSSGRSKSPSRSQQHQHHIHRARDTLPTGRWNGAKAVPARLQ